MLSSEDVSIGNIAGLSSGGVSVGMITSPKGYSLLKTITGPSSLWTNGRPTVEVVGYGGKGVTIAVPSSGHDWSGATSASKSVMLLPSSE